MIASSLLAGVELGGTKCVCVLATPDGEIRALERIATTTPDATLAAIETILEGWRGFSALGVAAFGPLDLDPVSPTWGHMLRTPKPGWSNISIAPRLAARFDVPVGFETDVTAAALAEGAWGAAQGLDAYAYVTVGTGVGVGVIVGGRGIRGLGHPEVGHTRVPRAPGDTWAGSCPFHGDCVEGLASGTAIKTRLGASSDTADESDPVWDLVAHALGGLCHNLVLTVAPERIIVGGGVANPRPRLLTRVRAALLDSLAGYGAAPAIAAQVDTFLAPPSLGDQAGPLGAIVVAAQASAHPDAPRRQS